MSFGYSDLERLAESLLSQESRLTPERIRALIADLRAVASVTDGEAEALARALETRHGVTMAAAHVLHDEAFLPWLSAARSRIDFYYWRRYRKLLESQHLSKRVVDAINNDTDRTLEFLQDPTLEGSWKRRGMVMGHVQSGKTANYIGVISKAADAGYRVIIVIAGIHNNLRNQTQKRIDSGFVGRDSARVKVRSEDTRIGVGKFDNTRRPVTFTTALRDFDKATATAVGMPLQDLREPAVFVVKKNPRTLQSMIEWIREHNVIASGHARVTAPLLLIDDEADNASINVAKPGAVSTINGLIRQLLQLFARSCYVGYTATPFANIFIDPDSKDEMLGDDLFPRHFIVSLDPPSNYFGATKVFLDEPDRFVRAIADSDAALPIVHKQSFSPTALPESLGKAIRAFVVARGIRLARGHTTEHCSMLVNVSRFTDVQSQVRSLIQGFLEPIQEAARLHCRLPVQAATKNPEMVLLRGVLAEEFATCGIDWATLQPLLADAASPIRVVEVNNRSHGALNYDDYKDSGLSVIAVGGYSLSRGLTLEGLMVSYYLRNSQMYDTLMQMGRWFGYRTDYEDLCRVWMPDEASGWYADIAESIEELREELRKMAANSATPADFGLKVRAHPDTLLVTARNKMGSSERVVVEIGLSGKLIETATVCADNESLSHNHELAIMLFRWLSEHRAPFVDVAGPGSTRVFSAVPAEPVLAFIRPFRNHHVSLLTDPAPVGRYIEERAADELAQWDVAAVALKTETAPKATPDTSLGFSVRRQTRSAYTGSFNDRTMLRLSNNRRVATVGAERIGLSSHEVERAEREFWDEQRVNEGSAKAVPDAAYRRIRTRPLLLVHLLTVASVGKEVAYSPVVAWSLSFPVSEREERHVEYVVTTTWMREHFGDQVGSEEFIDEEES
jgi:hypothetical protein